MSWKKPRIQSTVLPSTLYANVIQQGGAFSDDNNIDTYVTEYFEFPWLMEHREVGDELLLFTTADRKVYLKVTGVSTWHYYDIPYQQNYIVYVIKDANETVLFTCGRSTLLPALLETSTRLKFKACFDVYYDDETHKYIIGLLGQVTDTWNNNHLIVGSYANDWRSESLTEVYLAMGNIIPETDDPYEPAGYVNKQGGNGDFDSHSDPISIPRLPNISASDVGLLTLYNPTRQAVADFSDYLWSTGFDLDQFKKLFADPMDAIISLSIQPITPTGETEFAKIGLIATPVQMKKMNAQYYEIDCGELNITEFYGSALDYSPTTKFQIYLPYIGIQQLSPDDITTKTLRVVYHIDALTGDCICYLKVGASVLYTYTGNVATQVPVSSTNASTIYLSSSMRQVSGILSVFDSPKVTGAGAQGAMGQGILDMMTTKPSVNRSGSISGATGLMGIQKPYLIKEIPRQNLAKDAFKTVGYPSNISGTLSEFKGYTVVDEIHLENINATRAELDEIDSLLRGGYINAT